MTQEINKIYVNSTVRINSNPMPTLCFVDGNVQFINNYALANHELNIYTQSKDYITLSYGSNDATVYYFNLILKDFGVILEKTDTQGNWVSGVSEGKLLIFVDGRLLDETEYEVINDSAISLRINFNDFNFHQVVVYSSKEQIPYEKIIVESGKSFEFMYNRDQHLFFKNGYLIPNDHIFVDAVYNRLTINYPITETDEITYVQLPSTTQTLNFKSEDGYFTYGPEDDFRKLVPIKYDYELVFDDNLNNIVDDMRTGFILKSDEYNAEFLIVDDNFNKNNIKALNIQNANRTLYRTKEYYLVVPECKKIIDYLSDFDKKTKLIPEVLEVFQRVLLDEFQDEVKRLRNIRNISKVDSVHIDKLLKLLGNNLDVRNKTVRQKRELLEELTSYYRTMGTEHSYNILNTADPSIELSDMEQLFTIRNKIGEQLSKVYTTYNMDVFNPGDNYKVNKIYNLYTQNNTDTGVQIKVTNTANTIKSYITHGAVKYSSTWLSLTPYEEGGEAQVPLTPEEDKFYIVCDDITSNNTSYKWDVNSEKYINVNSSQISGPIANFTQQIIDTADDIDLEEGIYDVVDTAQGALFDITSKSSKYQYEIEGDIEGFEDMPLDTTYLCNTTSLDPNGINYPGRVSIIKKSVAGQNKIFGTLTNIEGTIKAGTPVEGEQECDSRYLEAGLANDLDNLNLIIRSIPSAEDKYEGVFGEQIYSLSQFNTLGTTGDYKTGERIIIKGNNGENDIIFKITATAAGSVANLTVESYGRFFHDMTGTYDSSKYIYDPIMDRPVLGHGLVIQITTKGVKVAPNKYDIMLAPGYYYYEMSGGGGGGASADSTVGSTHDIPSYNGYPGEFIKGRFFLQKSSKVTVYVAAGGGRAFARGHTWNGVAGQGGFGYELGKDGISIRPNGIISNKLSSYWWSGGCMSTGGGGGSSAILINDQVLKVARGGDGGWSYYPAFTENGYSAEDKKKGGPYYGGIGGNGGYQGSNVEGARGGLSLSNWDDGSFWSHNGENGWIRIKRIPIKYECSSTVSENATLYEGVEFKTSPFSDGSDFKAVITNFVSKSNYKTTYYYKNNNEYVNVKDFLGYTFYSQKGDAILINDSNPGNAINTIAYAKQFSGTLTIKSTPINYNYNIACVNQSETSGYSVGDIVKFAGADLQDFDLKIKATNAGGQITNFSFTPTNGSTYYNKTRQPTTLNNGINGEISVTIESSTVFDPNRKKEYIDFFTKEELGAELKQEYRLNQKDYGFVNEGTPSSPYPWTLGEADQDYGFITEGVQLTTVNKESWIGDTESLAPASERGEKTITQVQGYIEDAVDYDYGFVTDKIYGKWYQWWDWKRDPNYYPTNHVQVTVNLNPNTTEQEELERFYYQFYNIASTVLYIHNLQIKLVFGSSSKYKLNEDGTSVGSFNFGFMSGQPITYERHFFTSDPSVFPTSLLLNNN